MISILLIVWAVFIVLSAFVFIYIHKKSSPLAFNSYVYSYLALLALTPGIVGVIGIIPFLPIFAIIDFITFLRLKESRNKDE